MHLSWLYYTVVVTGLDRFKPKICLFLLAYATWKTAVDGIKAERYETTLRSEAKYSMLNKRDINEIKWNWNFYDSKSSLK